MSDTNFDDGVFDSKNAVSGLVTPSVRRGLHLTVPFWPQIRNSSAPPEIHKRERHTESSSKTHSSSRSHGTSAEHDKNTVRGIFGGGSSRNMSSDTDDDMTEEEYDGDSDDGENIQFMSSDLHGHQCQDLNVGLTGPGGNVQNEKKYIHRPMYTTMLPSFYAPLEDGRKHREIAFKLQMLILEQENKPQEELSKKISKWLYSVKEAEQMGDLFVPEPFQGIS